MGEFVYSLLTKRLLSCPYAFARTWWRHLEGSEDSEDATLFDMARVSAERAEEQAKSDDERTVLEDDAARYAGAWFRSKGRTSVEPLKKVNQALESLGLGKKVAEDEAKLAALARKADSKTEALVQWIKKNLFVDGKLRDDERLLVFTEYKESLFFLEQRLLQEGFDKNTLRLLYGGMDADDFEAVKSEFEDPTAAVRLLLATDAASEGINMQECCRWVIHYDVPWSPSKLQQRNGRVARHGQVRDVSTFYFRCDQEEDLAFLLKVAKKVEQVKQDLGSVERIFNAAIQRHFKGQAISFDRVSELVDQQIAESPEQTELSHSSPAEVADLTRRAKELLESTEARLGISSQALIDIMQAAITVEGQGSLEEIAGKPGFYRLKPPPRWEGLARQTLTVGSRTDRMELVFDSALVEEEPVPGRRVLRLKKHQTLLRLGHPILRQAMATLCRQLHDPDGHDAIFRWSIAGLHRSGFEALLAFQYTVTAINELREPLHDEVVATVFRVEGNQTDARGRRVRADRLAQRVPPDQVCGQAGRLVEGLAWPLVPAQGGTRSVLASAGKRSEVRAGAPGRNHLGAGTASGQGKLPVPLAGIAGPQPGTGPSPDRQGVGPSAGRDPAVGLVRGDSGRSGNGRPRT